MRLSFLFTKENRIFACFKAKGKKKEKSETKINQKYKKYDTIRRNHYCDKRLFSFKESPSLHQRLIRKKKKEKKKETFRFVINSFRFSFYWFSRLVDAKTSQHQRCTVAHSFVSESHRNKMIGVNLTPSPFYTMHQRLFFFFFFRLLFHFFFFAFYLATLPLLSRVWKAC